jgi:hypothetical protein
MRDTKDSLRLIQVNRRLTHAWPAAEVLVVACVIPANVSFICLVALSTAALNCIRELDLGRPSEREARNIPS